MTVPSFNHKVVSAFPRAVFRRALTAVFGKKVLFKFEIDKRIALFVGNKNDTAAVAAVAAVRSAVRHKLFAVKTDSSVAAVACLYENFYVI